MAFEIYRCPSCSATLLRDATKCAYCGVEVHFVQPGGALHVEARAPLAQELAWIEEVRAEVRAGRKIHAIKALRVHSGLGLRESKDFVESGAFDDADAVARLGPSKAGQKRASCFPADARVATPWGPRAIAALRVGDEVLSWSRTGVVARPVTAIVAYPCAELWEVLIAGRDPVTTTAHHTFRTQRGWVRADKLRAHDALGEAIIVEAVRAAGRVARVYNLRTAVEHNFIVEGVVAHNFTTLRALRVLWHRAFVDPLGGACAGRERDARRSPR